MNTKRILLFAAFFMFAGLSFAKPFQEGVHYVPIEPMPPVGEGDRVEVLEFFMYLCPHCKAFEPAVNAWKKRQPENVDFQQVPAMFGGAANMHAKAFYALETMGERDRLHDAFFAAIHDEKKDLKTREALETWLQSQGVDVEKFRAAMGSFAVAAKANRAQTLMRRYGIRSVPATVVDGRYRSGSGFRNYEEITEVLDHVVDKVLQERKTK